MLCLGSGLQLLNTGLIGCIPAAESKDLDVLLGDEVVFGSHRTLESCEEFLSMAGREWGAGSQWGHCCCGVGSV